MSVQPVLTLNNLTKNYSGLTSAGVNNISFSVFSGEIISVVGESGSGKSTLLKLIYGLLTPDAGTVVFKEKVVRGPEQKLIPGHEQMKMVTQDFSLNIYAKVYENIASLLPNTNLKYKQEKTWEMMKFLRIDHLADKRAVDLSGGEQQRVAIAKAIITNPDILLLDEPFSQVDPLLKTDLRADIKRLSRDLGITVILVSHDPIDGLSLADRLVILKKGDIQEIGTPRDLYVHPAKAYTIQLLSNCSVLSKEEAKVIGIETLKEKVAIHAEWVAVDESSKLTFTVKDIIYKGFYEELLLGRDGVIIKALNLAVGTIPVGGVVPISIKEFIQFDE